MIFNFKSSWDSCAIILKDVEMSVMPQLFLCGNPVDIQALIFPKGGKEHTHTEGSTSFLEGQVFPFSGTQSFTCHLLILPNKRTYGRANLSTEYLKRPLK